MRRLTTPLPLGPAKLGGALQPKTLVEAKRGSQPIAPHGAPDRLYGEIGRFKMNLIGSQRVCGQLGMTRRNWIGIIEIKDPVRKSQSVR